MAAELKKVPIPSRGVDYRGGKVVLAPMVRSGELPTRLLSLKYGADLVWGPEVVDRAIIGATRRVVEKSKIVEWVHNANAENQSHPGERIIFRTSEKEAGKMVFQVGTADPELAVKAAQLVAADVNEIGVNAGCPKPFSTKGGMGAALLQTPDKLCSILRALVENVGSKHDISISVKIRILDTAAQTEALVRQLCATGITGLTVHCRTTPMRPRERAIRGQLRMVADVCHEAGVACLMNGDVANKDQGIQLAAEFGADGAMIATAAEKNPSCFRTQAEGGLLPWKEVVEDYLRICMEVDNRFANTKFLLTQMVVGKDPAYQKMHSAKSYQALCEAFGFDHLVEQAKEVDKIAICQPQPQQKKKQKQKEFKEAQINKKRANENPSGRAAGGDMSRNSQREPLSARGASTSKQTETAPVALAS
ncbi:putative tRNA dihydrouridine synthase [Emericellopsis atlantica]|uniref:tRNA dihydrouridine synthase n=1 Tax=Emericellopsis atlantica TaxID=2614577 RepID=A0A9P7ZSR5_9HYPO|nr:putative tRNA dihydrouridine synthase [Emericellopsis atlantica]KAG9257000.1 putative tRNA dihydrouridine synthase [Emericellopsis atlantica]